MSRRPVSFAATLLTVGTLAVLVSLSGCTLPASEDGQATAPTTTSSTPTPRPSTITTPTPTPTPTPEPSYPPLPPADGDDPEASGDWTTELAYQSCVDAPDADPAQPIQSYSALAESRVDQSGPGVWLVVIPVVRSIDGAAGAGQQVCFIDGTPDDPAITVAPSL